MGFVPGPRDPLVTARKSSYQGPCNTQSQVSVISLGVIMPSLKFFERTMHTYTQRASRIPTPEGFFFKQNFEKTTLNKALAATCKSFSVEISDFLWKGREARGVAAGGSRAAVLKACRFGSGTASPGRTGSASMPRVTPLCSRLVFHWRMIHLKRG